MSNSDKDPQNIRIHIDDKEIDVKRGTLLIEATETYGIWIPTLCYNKGLEPYGACRLCSVEIEENGRQRIQAACSYRIEKPVKIKTLTPEIKHGRVMIINLLLARCTDQPELKKILRKILETEQEPPLYGLEKRIIKVNKDDPVQEDQCILCGLCVRVCSEIVGANAIGFYGRGVSKKVKKLDDPEDSILCIACGACTYVCPTDAIQMESFTIKKFLELPAAKRYCRYMRMGLVSFKVCPNKYECWHCEVDQGFTQLLNDHPLFISKRAEMLIRENVHGVTLMKDRNYNESHIWIKRQGTVFKIGIDDFLIGKLNKITEIKFLKGKNEKAFTNEIFIEIKGKGPEKLTLKVPFDCTVLENNTRLQLDQQLLIRDPWFRGWCSILKPIDDKSIDLKSFYSGLKAKFWLEKEIKKSLV